MAELKTYRAKVGEFNTELRLTEETARARGLVEAGVKQAPRPANKQAGAPANKQAPAPAGKRAPVKPAPAK